LTVDAPACVNQPIFGREFVMLLIILLALLAIAGWLRWPWWTPFAALVVSGALLFWEYNTIVASGAAVGLSPPDWQFIASRFGAALAMQLLAYWLGRGLVHAMGSKRA